MNRIHDMAVLMSADGRLMANSMMKSAVNYLLNQWKSLEHFIRDGRVQISNILCTENENGETESEKLSEHRKREGGRECHIYLLPDRKLHTQRYKSASISGENLPINNKQKRI